MNGDGFVRCKGEQGSIVFAPVVDVMCLREQVMRVDWRELRWLVRRNLRRALKRDFPLQERELLKPGILALYA